MFKVARARFRFSVFRFSVYIQPRSQGLSSLPPLVVGRKTLVAAGHVTSCDTNFSTGVESTDNFIIFVDLNWSERKDIANYTFEIFQSCCKLHTGQTKYIYWSITLISLPAALCNTRTKTVSLFHVAWIIKPHGTLFAS